MTGAGATRRIWLCADDYGIAPGVNRAIRDLVARGRLNATSVMVRPPSFSKAEADALTALNADRQRVAIGLHLTLSAPFMPLWAKFRPRKNDRFHAIGTMLQLAMLRRLDPESLMVEISAQFEEFAEIFGRTPDFVDGHQHVHLFPQVRDAVLHWASLSAHGAWVRQCGSVAPLMRRLADPKGLLIDRLSRAFRKRAAAARIKTNPAFAGTYAFNADADIATLFPGFLDGLPDGGLIMCHPGFVDAELTRLDPLTTLREREYAYFASDAFPAMLAARGVTLS